MFDPAYSSDASKNTKGRDQALRKQSLKHSWPMLIMIPALVGILHAAAFSLLIKLFLGETFGLSNGHPAPWPGAIAVIFMVSFWTNRIIGRWNISSTLAQIATFIAWFMIWLGWIWIDPAFNSTNFWSSPGQLVQSEAWLIPPLLISMAVWWTGMTYAVDIVNISAEEVRTVVQRDWIVLFASVLLAALIGGTAGSDALNAARIAVPLLLIVSLALIAGAETEVTRRIAIRRGGTAPGWGRWLRLVGGFTIGILLISTIVLALLSPGALEAIVNGMATVARFVGWILAYVLYAVIWSVFQVASLIGRLLAAIFGDMFGPVEAPEMPVQQGFEMDEIAPRDEETGTWQYAILLRWAGLIAVVTAVAILIFRLTRRPASDDDDGDVDEHRDSVFSTDLAKQQLRDLFRRRQREGKPLRLDLDQSPQDVRETMMYLEVLAKRQGEERRPEETATDFAARLRAHWAGLGAPLIELHEEYDRARYGEVTEPGDAEFARRTWTSIWSKRKTTPPPEARS
jgi:hypothetical protein